MRKTVPMRDALDDPALLGNILGGDSWRTWRATLIAAMGEAPIMAEGKWISYLRVSTDRQGRSGLGLESQRAAVDNFLNGDRWLLVKEFVEVESGKHPSGPQTRQRGRSTHCRRHRAADHHGATGGRRCVPAGPRRRTQSTRHSHGARSRGLVCDASGACSADWLSACRRQRSQRRPFRDREGSARRATGDQSWQ
jgi:Resolvase, N terminal domain